MMSFNRHQTKVGKRNCFLSSSIKKTENGKFSIFLYLQKGALGDFVPVCHSTDEMLEKCLQRCSQMMRLCLHNNEISDPGLIVRVLNVLTCGHY